MNAAATPAAPRSVSARAAAGLDDFVAQAVRNALRAPGQDAALQPLDAEAPLAPEPEVVMLTVSSYLFRALLFIHVDRSPAWRGYMAALAGGDAEDYGDERFLDALMERGNLACGAFNRELAHYYPHTGMSTPCLLERGSLDHVRALQPALTRRYRVQATPDLALHLTLALCAFADIDFAFQPRAVEVEEEAAGELEMF